MKALACVLFAVACGALAGCDNSQAFHEPHLSWERMIEQPRAEPYGTSAAFENRVAMRSPPPGTVQRGAVPGEGAHVPVTRALLELGRDRFETFCGACHGLLGDGVSVVATKMELRRPPSLHEDRIRALPDEKILDVITNGYGLMAGYAVQLSERERAAVAAYVRALQLSQNAHVADLPPQIQSELAKEAP